MFQKDAAVVAQRIARCKGYMQATEQDIIVALKYQVVHFFEQGELEERFLDALKCGVDEEEEEEEEGKEGEEGEEGEEEEEGETGEEWGGEEEESDPVADAAFLQDVQRIDEEWDTWQPQDEVQNLLKSAIDRTQSEMIST